MMLIKLTPNKLRLNGESSDGVTPPHMQGFIRSVHKYIAKDLSYVFNKAGRIYEVTLEGNEQKISEIYNAYQGTKRRLCL